MKDVGIMPSGSVAPRIKNCLGYICPAMVERYPRTETESLST